MKSSKHNIIVSGSSFTDSSAWPTWATWINYRYKPDFFINCGIKGIGNEVILLKAIAEAKKHKDPVVVVQLTNVDKWDWYVENIDLAEQLMEEKHSLIKLSPEDKYGFWSTGSHFPKWKEHYKNNYFSLEHSTYRTLQLIQWFQLLCKQQHWKYYIIFDSPIFSVTETYLNTGNLTIDECYSTSLVNNTLTSNLFDLIDFENIYMPGIIGYAKINSFPWYTKKVKGHPGSLVHYEFTKDIICPVLDQIIEPFQSLDAFRDEASFFQNLFLNL